MSMIPSTIRLHLHISQKPVNYNLICRLFASRRDAKTKVSRISSTTADGKWILPTFIHRAEHGTNSLSKFTRKSPVLLICGWTGVATDWGAVPSMLASKTGRDVITYDARGMGNSIRLSDRATPLELSMDLMASDAIAVMSTVIGNFQMEKTTFKVGGVSMGGMIAQLVAGATKGHVSLPNPPTTIGISSLLLICTTPVGVPRTMKPKNRAFFRAFHDWVEHDDMKQRECAEIFFSALGDDFVSSPGKRKLKQILVNSFVETRNSFANDVKEGIMAQLAAVQSFDSRHFIRGVSADIPAVIVHGKNDGVIPAENGVNLKQMMGGAAEIRLIEECDHLCWVTHGVELVTILTGFMNEFD